jgi:hypothetical protein
VTELTLKQACAETQKFGRMLKGMERLVDVAAALESADQAVSDRRREETQIQERIATATAELATLTNRIEGAREEAQAIGRAATEQADATVSNARTEAESILTAARTEESHARAASSEVIARANAAERRLKAAQDELAQVEARLEQAKAEGRKIFAG